MKNKYDRKKILQMIAASAVMVFAQQSNADEDGHKHVHESDKEHHEEEKHGEHKHDEHKDEHREAHNHDEHKHDDEHRAGLGAHEHGHGQLNVVVENAEVHIEFHVPAMNLVGFEHKAETPEQKEAVASAVEQLQQAASLFKVDEAAECDFAEVSAEHHEPEDGGEHSEFEASYKMQCAKPEKLTELDVSLFDVLDNMEEIEVQLVTPDMQTLIEVTDKEHTVPLTQ